MPDSHSDFEPGRLSVDIPIFQKAYEFYKSFYTLVAHFPKKDRFTIGQKIESTILDLIEDIITASQLNKQEKLPVLKRASVKLDLLKIFIRMSKDLKILDNKKYLLLESQILEIGRMLGGWIRASA